MFIRAKKHASNTAHSPALNCSSYPNTTRPQSRAAKQLGNLQLPYSKHSTKTHELDMSQSYILQSYQTSSFSLKYKHLIYLQVD